MNATRKGKEYKSGQWFYVEVFSAEHGHSLYYETYCDSMTDAVKVVKRYCQQELDGLFQMNGVKAYQDYNDIPLGLNEVFIPTEFSTNVIHPQR